MRAETLHKMCLGKKPYRSDAEAQRRIDAKAQQGINLRSYWCEVCGKFHITKKGVTQPKPLAKEQEPAATTEPLPQRKHFILPPVVGPRPVYTSTVEISKSDRKEKFQFRKRRKSRP